METYFNIRYEMDKEAVWQSIDRFIREQAPTYICVADGVILNITNRNPEYLKVVNGSAFSICDSSYVPIYLKWIYGIHREQYCGSQIFMDLIKMKKYRMFFMGTSAKTLAALKENLVKIDSRIADLAVEMEQLEDGLRTMDAQTEQHRVLEQDAAQIKTDRALTGALIERLIDRIEVSHDKQITVRYRFQSEFETYAEVLEQCRNM